MIANPEMRLQRRTYRLINETRGTIVAESIGRTENFWERLVGLALRRKITPGEGVWIEPCNGIHTVGMRFPIDVVMLDRRGDVMGILRNVPPFRIIRSKRGWMGTVEIYPGELGSEDVEIGDRLRLAE